MKSNRVTEFFAPYKTMEKNAERDYHALTHNQISGQDVPSTVLAVLTAYLKLLRHDVDVMNNKLKNVFCDHRAELEFLLGIVKGMLSHTGAIKPEDMKRINQPEMRKLKEYRHFQDFDKISHELSTYINSAEIYLGQLHADLVQAGRTKLMNEMFGVNDTDQGRAHFLMNFNKIIKIMKAGSDDVDVSKFYSEQLEKINKLSFVPGVPANAMKP